jgi:RNA polymerase sigma factor (sigma-70 family)
MRNKAEAQARRADVVASDFESIYRRHNRQVFLWCARIVRNTADAEDLTQEAFIHLLRKIDTYRGEAAFASWLYRLTTNLVLMWLRKKVLPQTSLDEILEANEGAIKASEELKTFDRTLAGFGTCSRASASGSPIGLCPARQRKLPAS